MHSMRSKKTPRLTIVCANAAAQYFNMLTKYSTRQIQKEKLSSCNQNEYCEKGSCSFHWTDPMHNRLTANIWLETINHHLHPLPSTLPPSYASQPPSVRKYFCGQKEAYYAFSEFIENNFSSIYWNMVYVKWATCSTHGGNGLTLKIVHCEINITVVDLFLRPVLSYFARRPFLPPEGKYNALNTLITWLKTINTVNLARLNKNHYI